MKPVKNRGSLLIEVLVSSALAVVFSMVIGSLVSMNSRLVTVARHDSEATGLAKEAMEKLFAMKQQSWSSIGGVPLGSYFINQNGNAFVLAPDSASHGEHVGEIYTRTVKIYSAFRDAEGALSESGTVGPDVNVRRIESTVSWKERGADRSVKLTSYVTNWKGL